MNKTTLAISAPVDTYSGYGARARDIVRALLATEKYDIQILSQRWGNTRFGYLKDHNDTELTPLIVPNLTAQPEVWVQITVPNEFQPVGKYNIGITAGIETTLCAPEWIDGCNRMNLVLTSSNHSKAVFENSQFEKRDQKTQALEGIVKLETRVEVLFEGVDTDKYFPTKTKVKSDLVSSIDEISESFCYLFVGHWLPGSLGHDRKNIGYTIKAFLETFKNKQNAPALVLKTMRASTSIMDRENVLKQINSIRSTVKGKLPNIYLLHGEVSDEEMNNLYNHPKIKAMVSFTKGEGFGRPLLEFAATKKLVIASGWSGHMDFLNTNDALIVGGDLEKVDKSASTKNVILTEASWFRPDDGQVAKAFKESYKNYKQYSIGAKRLGTTAKKEFSLERMTEVLDELLIQYLPQFPKRVELKLPNLDLPTLK